MSASRVYRVLLVEDNPADVYLIELALRQAGLSVDLSLISDGAAALEFLEQVAAEAVPDLAIIDLNLPRVGGAEVLRALRGNSLVAHMPVAVMTSSSSPHDRAQVEQMGVEHYLTKPPELEGFLKIGDVLRALLLPGRPV